jgi:hypothetical protein
MRDGFRQSNFGLEPEVSSIQLTKPRQARDEQEDFVNWIDEILSLVPLVLDPSVPIEGYGGYAGGSCGMVEGTQELHRRLLMLLRPGV